MLITDKAHLARYLKQNDVSLIEKRLGEILLERNLISTDQLERALEIQRKAPESGRLGTILLEMDALKPAQLKQAIAQQLKIAERRLPQPDTAAQDIEQQARRDGMRPLTEGALEIARQGIISLAEVYRVRLE